MQRLRFVLLVLPLPGVNSLKEKRAVVRSLVERLRSRLDLTAAEVEHVMTVDFASPVRMTLAVLPGCSHFLPDDAADTVVPLVVEWLRGRYLGTPHRHADGPVEVFLGRRPPPEAERMDT